MTDDPIDPRDIPILRALAGANFGPNSSVTLPSGRRLDASEAQVLTSAYAPAYDEAEQSLNHRIKPGSMPRDGDSLVAHYLTNGGDPNPGTMAILDEADRRRSGWRRR